MAIKPPPPPYSTKNRDIYSTSDTFLRKASFNTLKILLTTPGSQGKPGMSQHVTAYLGKGPAVLAAERSVWVLGFPPHCRQRPQSSSASRALQCLQRGKLREVKEQVPCIFFFLIVKDVQPTS